MVIDSCAFLGQYPFRKTSNQSAKELVQLMDQKGIDKAVVSSIQGVYYRDMMDGNLELFEEIAPYSDRLIPAANINPEYPCAMDDLEQCVLEFGCKEIRLWPKQTKGDVCNEAYQSIMRRCAQLNVPVAFCIEDVRGRHPLDITAVLSPFDVEKVAGLIPEVDIVIHNPTYYGYVELLEKVERTGKVYYGLGKLEAIYNTSLLTTVNNAGFDRVLFDTCSPLQYVEPQYVKLWTVKEKLNASDADMDKIYCKNAQNLYKL